VAELDRRSLQSDRDEVGRGMSQRSCLPLRIAELRLARELSGADGWAISRLWMCLPADDRDSAVGLDEANVLGLRA